MTGVPVPMPPGPDPIALPALARLLAAVPVATILLEPGCLALAAGNAAAATLLDAAPGDLATAWRDTLAEWPELRQRLAAVESCLAPEAFEATLDRPGRPLRHFRIQALHVAVEGQALVSAVLVDITHHRQAEKALAAAHERLEVALHGAGLGAWHWDCGTGRVEVSAGWAAMLGFDPPPASLTLEEWLALLHPQDRPRLRRMLALPLSRVAARHETARHETARHEVAPHEASPYQAECRMRHRDGHWIWVLTRGRVTRHGPDGQVQAMIGTHLDITARRAAEASATEHTTRLHALFEANPIAVHRSHADGRVLDANAAFLRILGATRAELEAGSLRWDALSLPEWVSSDLAARDEALAKGYCTPYEKEYLLPNGSRVPVLVGFAVLDRGGCEFAAFVLDLTAQKQAEAGRATSEREARRRLADFEALYRTTPLDHGQMDRDLRFVRVNEALAEMNGHSVEAHVGRLVWDLVPDLREVAELHLLQVLRTGEPVTNLHLAGETPKQPGRQRDWLAHFHPVHHPETQAVVGVGVVCEEVTERRQAERARELLLRELDHRVKNLFAVVGGLVSFTARTAATPDAMRKTLLGRIGALARAHDLVRPALIGAAVDRAAGPTLVQLLEALMEPFRTGFGQPERLRLAGPPVLLGQTGAPPLALALHELATNAAKHGALAGDGGRISIDWTVLPAVAQEALGPLPGAVAEPLGPSLLLRWREWGGPAIDGPGHAGFGQRLITQSCVQLGGTARIDWNADGLAAELLLPLQRLAR